MTASNPSLSWWLSIAGEWKHDLNNKGLAETSALLEADILIVGAGISGASLALALREARPHLKVAVVESRCVSGGATGRNGGLVWPGLNATWDDTVALHGEEGAKKLLAFEEACFARVVGFIREHGLEKEVQFSTFPDGGFTLWESKDQQERETRDLGHQAAAGAKACVGPALSPTDLQKLGLVSKDGSAAPFVGGINQPQVSRVTAALLAQALMKKAAAIEPTNNLVVWQHTTVTHVEHLGSPGRDAAAAREADEENVARGGHFTPRLMATLVPTQQLSKGAGRASEMHVLAGRVVHCTNGYNNLLPKLKESSWVVPVRNQVAVTKPLPPNHPLPHAGFSMRGNFVYLSRRADNRVVIGGFRDVTPHKEWGTLDDSLVGLDPHVSACLRSYLPETFPHWFCSADSKGAGAQQAASGSKAVTPFPLEYELEWSGILGFTRDRWPLVGWLPPTLTAAAQAAVSGGARVHVAPMISAAYASARGDVSSLRGYDHQQQVVPSPTSASLGGMGGGGGDTLPSWELCCMGFSGHGMTRAFTCARNTAFILLGMSCEPGFPAAALSPDRCLSGHVPPVTVQPSAPHIRSRI